MAFSFANTNSVIVILVALASFLMINVIIKMSI